MGQGIKLAGMLVAVSVFIISSEARRSTSNARTSGTFSDSIPDHPRDIQAPIDRDLRAQLDQYLSRVTSELNFSGSVLVAKGERIVLHNGYGWADLKKTVPVNSETRFFIASITKQFTAAAILKLEEQHRLNVKSSITEFFDVPQDKRGITIHHLLTHTSGLAQNYAADGIVDRDEAVKAILKPPLQSLPGEKFGYSNDGYNLLAVIVEKASGQSYESFLGRTLLQPARMSQTGFWGDSLANRRTPIAQMLRDIPVGNQVANWGFRGAVGMSSTTGDLYKWQQALLSDRVLKKSSRKRLFTPYAPTSRGMYTYGWFVSKTKQGLDLIWTAGSEQFGHNAIIKRYADGTVVIVASNSGDISGVPARTLISDELEHILFNTSEARTK